MSSDLAISLSGLGKCYQIYNAPRDRLLQMLVRGHKQYYREFWALKEVSLEVGRGEVLGIVGRNGAGKSTLLQLVCGTLNATTGNMAVNGRVSALLELGAGFNPEFTGRENVYLSATVLGLSPAEIDARYDDIVAFSGIGDFIHQPVKTYSSGMYVRLAFSVATCVDPDILVVDEALSVGDGAFARKSFDRIMQLKEKGVTILFCSHSLYQVEALCNRVLWLEKGQVALQGAPADVLAAFRQSLEQEALEAAASDGSRQQLETVRTGQLNGCACIDKVAVFGSMPGECRLLRSGVDDLKITVAFSADPALETPAVVFEIFSESGSTVSSGGSRFDGFEMVLDEDGRGEVELYFPKIPLMRGRYHMSIYLTCDRMLHVYDQAQTAVTFEMHQPNIEKGVVFLGHQWHAVTRPSSHSGALGG